MSKKLEMAYKLIKKKERTVSELVKLLKTRRSYVYILLKILEAEKKIKRKWDENRACFVFYVAE